MNFVSIITVNYNHSSVTEDLLNSILRINSYKNIEVIVVDNGSKMNSVPQWKKKYPWVKFIRSEENLGFAGGNNLGIKEAKGEYLFLINNDTVVTENLIEILVNTLDQNEKVGMISPKILYYDSPTTLQYIGFTEMNYITGRNKQLGNLEKDNGQYDSLVGKTGFAHGAAMMVKREVIEKAGLMAENFFLYYEELDWCERIKQCGFEVWVTMKAAIYHKESMSVGKQSALKEYYMNRNRILFIRKHASLPGYLLFLSYFLLIVAPKSIIGYIKIKQYRFITLILKAITWNLKNSINSNSLYFPANN